MQTRDSWMKNRTVYKLKIDVKFPRGARNLSRDFEMTR